MSKEQTCVYKKTLLKKLEHYYKKTETIFTEYLLKYPALEKSNQVRTMRLKALGLCRTNYPGALEIAFQFQSKFTGNKTE